MLEHYRAPCALGSAPCTTSASTTSMGGMSILELVPSTHTSQDFFPHPCHMKAKPRVSSVVGSKLANATEATSPLTSEIMDEMAIPVPLGKPRKHHVPLLRLESDQPQDTE